MNIKHVGEGKVCLLAGGDKIYTDIAARFVRSERSLEDIIASEYDATIVENILKGGHLAATEFDYFIFGIEGYARVTEVQLVRKRIASYLIKSGRIDKGGNRAFDIVLPENIENNRTEVNIDPENILVRLPGNDLGDTYTTIDRVIPEWVTENNPLNIKVKFTTFDILNIIESWYNTGVEIGLPEEDLRYMKPQATEFKAIIGMNAHGLLDWFKIRTCLNAQKEINHLARNMMQLCKDAAPDLFKDAGPNCVSLGYCPENKYQNRACVGKVITKENAIPLLKTYLSTISNSKEGINPNNSPMWK